MTLIEAAMTMLADSLLPTVFWDEAVNTACYVLNRVLVTKPHNKTPYELIIGRPPSISFMRPFGCPVTILNTLDPLGKFDGKAEEGFLVRFQVQPKVSHLNAVKRIFRYLKGRPKLGLWYPKDSPFILEAFSDCDYAGASLDRKSTTGGCQFLSSRSKIMQTKIHVDNESAICVVKNPVYHSKTKHIEIRHHFIRDSYEKRLIEMVKINTDNNVADLLTKAFDFLTFIHGLCIDMDPYEFSLVYLVISSMLVPNKGMLLHTPEGEGSVTPPEPQPTPSTSQPNVFHEPQTEAHIEQILPSSTTYQRNRKTQKRGDSVERAITIVASLDAIQDNDNIIKTQTTTMPNVDIPQGMDTGGSPRRQDTMGVLLLRLGLRECLKSPMNHLSQKVTHLDVGRARWNINLNLMANVPITPHDSPLLGVLDLEKKKDVQSVEILRLKKRVKRLERQRKSSTSQPRMRKYRQFESSDDDLDEEDASKQGRSSDKTKLIREKVSTDQELLEKMLNLQLDAKEASTMAFELIKFIKSMIEE
ncbi:putative ribonuclease H-like domain-containing protein [Tanacetum coccineum]